MTERRFVGVDLGQANDCTALAVLDKSGDGEDATYAVRHLERFQRGTPYPDQVRRVHALYGRLSRAESPRIDVVVDQTGVGRPVVDMLRNAGLIINAVTITGGDSVSRDVNEYRVPKRDLVSTVQVLLQAGKLKIVKGLPEAELLVEELLGFKVRVSARGHDTYGNDVGEWRETAHDDLVLAVALAAWFGESVMAPMLFFI